jgi:hypothetical protein
MGIEGLPRSGSKNFGNGSKNAGSSNNSSYESGTRYSPVVP